MVNYIFEHDGDRGVLKLTTHNHQVKTIECQKAPHQTFRVGGTASNGLMQRMVIPKTINRSEQSVTVELAENSSIILLGSLYEFSDCRLNLNQPAIALEYYPLDMEGKPPQWVIIPRMIEQPELLFVNVDCLDGGYNIVKRYRVSPYTGECRVMEMSNGS